MQRQDLTPAALLNAAESRDSLLHTVVAAQSFRNNKQVYFDFLIGAA
jgi:hypothetical protein